MGTQCARISPKPPIYHLQNRLESLETEPMKCSESLHLQIKIENLRVFNLNERVGSIQFLVQNSFLVSFAQVDSTIQEKAIKWNKNHQAILQVNGDDLERKKMQVLIFDHKSKIIQKLSFKLHQLCTGPYHQDHLLKEMKARLAFDIRITQKISVTLKIENFELGIFQQNRNQLKNFGYSLCLKALEDDKIYETQPQFQLPNALFPQINLHCEMLNDILKQSTIRIEIWKKDNIIYQKYPNNACIFTDIYIPFRKILTDLYKTIVENQKQYQIRKLEFSENILFQGKQKGKVSFSLTAITSKLYVQQMQCLIFSQNGIGTISPHVINQNQDANTQINEIENQLLKLKKIGNYGNKQKNMLKQTLAQIYQMTKKNSKICYTTQKQLSNLQSLLIQILIKVAKMLRQGQDVMNENLWRIVNTIIHRPQLSIRYLNYLPQGKQKQEVGAKFYCFICLLLEKIIQSTTIGVTFHQLQCIQKFVAYAYFRFPWIQKVVLKQLVKADDPQVTQDKLLQIGACLASKSPAKSFVYDWQSSLFKYCLNHPQFKSAFSDLQDLTYQIPQWSQILFNRNQDDLFYGLLIQIWNQAQITLMYQEKVKWQYFPHYGELLGAFMGQMNQNKIIDYSSQFKACSLKLILNQRLLNSFMMSLFPKTHLYQSYCVMKCLDLLSSYFQVVTKNKKKLPTDFNFSYFYTGIRTVLDSDHSYLLVKTLTIIYTYYHLFSTQFKATINNYILGKGFFPLFLHWCGYVRRIFHLILQFKVKPSLFECNPQDLGKNQSSIQNFQTQHKFENLLKKIQQTEFQQQREQEKSIKNAKKQYFQQMKVKFKKKKNENKYGQQNVMAMTWNCQFDIRRKASQIEHGLGQSYKCRKWSMGAQQIDINQIPQTHKRYIKISMNQFRKIMQEGKPDQKVMNIENLFNQGGVSIDS